MEKNKTSVPKATKLGKKKSIDKNVHELALERIHTAYDRFDTVIVMFSGGKDSTACLDLTLQVAKERGHKKVEVHHFDEEAIPYETEDYVRRIYNHPMVDMKWWCLPIKHRNACSINHPWWHCWAPEKKDKWCRPLPPEGITELEHYPTNPDDRLTIPLMNGLLFPPEKYGNVGMVMGIRCDESITRTRAILQSSSRDDIHIIKFDDGTALGNVYKVYPVYDWNTQDIWTAPKKFGWDYNRAYDVMDKLGLSPNFQRCAPPYGEEPMRSLDQFRTCFPDVWDAVSQRVDGAATAARYANTQLYAYRKNPDKPKGMSWQDFLKKWIDKHPSPWKEKIAHNVRLYVELHYKKTSDPIMPSPHPISGVGWNFLLKIAVRGDYKGRKQPAFANEEDLPRLKRKYNEERFRESTNQ